MEFAYVLSIHAVQIEGLMQVTQLGISMEHATQILPAMATFELLQIVQIEKLEHFEQLLRTELQS
jgi:hypothetical protein